MPIPWVVRWAGVLIISAVGLLGQVAQTSDRSALLSPKVVVSSPVAGPFGLYGRPMLVGIYGADGIFRKTALQSQSSGQESTWQGLRPAEVPPGVDLHSIERVVEDYEPPAHAKNAAKGQWLLGSLRDRAAGLAYGRERVLLAPTHVTTDSRQRLIISDPGIPAVHVLDAAGKSSFRIVGGPHHRLRMPNGVATDAADNIYVADRQRGMVLVYDPEGMFLRYIGNFKGESMFAAPAGIAIDRKSGHLFVLDSPMNELIVLDLQGNVLQRVGNGYTAKVAFHLPTEIALGNQEMAILDEFGARLQVFDLNGSFLRAFTIANVSGERVAREIGLSIDSRSNVYVSNVNGCGLRVYDRDGQLVDGVAGSRFDRAQLNGPGGLWVDASDHVYIADTGNRRIQVFLVADAPDKSQLVESMPPRSTQ